MVKICLEGLLDIYCRHIIEYMISNIGEHPFGCHCEGWKSMVSLSHVTWELLIYIMLVLYFAS